MDAVWRSPTGDSHSLTGRAGPRDDLWATRRYNSRSLQSNMVLLITENQLMSDYFISDKTSVFRIQKVI